MESIAITLGTMLIGKVIDEMAYRYRGKKYPKLKEYPGFLGMIAKRWAGRK